jgi:hypothetical protein
VRSVAAALGVVVARPSSISKRRTSAVDGLASSEAYKAHSRDRGQPDGVNRTLSGCWDLNPGPLDSRCPGAHFGTVSSQARGNIQLTTARQRTLFRLPRWENAGLGPAWMPSGALQRALRVRSVSVQAASAMASGRTTIAPANRPDTNAVPLEFRVFESNRLTLRGTSELAAESAHRGAQPDAAISTSAPASVSGSYRRAEKSSADISSRVAISRGARRAYGTQRKRFLSPDIGSMTSPWRSWT